LISDDIVTPLVALGLISKELRINQAVSYIGIFGM